MSGEAMAWVTVCALAAAGSLVILSISLQDRRRARRRVILAATRGPQGTASEAYRHVSDILAAEAEKSRKQNYPGERAWIRTEVIEQLAFTLGIRAEEAKRTEEAERR